jgi:hypothetical protein
MLLSLVWFSRAGPFRLAPSEKRIGERPAWTGMLGRLADRERPLRPEAGRLAALMFRSHCGTGERANGGARPDLLRFKWVSLEGRTGASANIKPIGLRQRHLNAQSFPVFSRA